MKIYLDIDGVILANERQKANFADEFIKHLVGNYDVYWLTTHSRGDNVFVLQLLSQFFSPEMMEIIKKIKPTNWNEWKTEAIYPEQLVPSNVEGSRGIDFNEDFRWFDDQLFPEEIEVLNQHNKLSSWIEIDLSKDPNQLKSFVV